MNHYDDPLVVQNYACRCPYLPSFFKEIARVYSIGQSSHVLDLCCGRGEVSQYIAPYCQDVLAIDQSTLMLSHAPAIENVRYQSGDLNNFTFLQSLPKKHFHSMFVGRGIHWINRESLRYLVSNCLVSDAYLFTTQSGFRSSTPWLRGYYEVLNNQLCSEAPSVDWICRDKVLDSGLRYLGDTFTPFHARLSLDFLVGQAMSYRADRAQEIEKNKGYIKQKINEALAIYMQDGHLSADLFTSASIYQVRALGANFP
jgi:SAM-dependent methyltransferase